MAARGGAAGPGSKQTAAVGSGRPVSERLREAREELEAKLLRLEEDERDQTLLSGQPLTVADIERAMAAAEDGGRCAHAETELDIQLARRVTLDRPLLDSSAADDPFAGVPRLLILDFRHRSIQTNKSSCHCRTGR